MLKKVAILANGGDVSGFNAVIRAIIKTAEQKGIDPICYETKNIKPIKLQSNFTKKGFEDAVQKMSSVLAVTGKVLPVTLDDMKLVAELENGNIVDSVADQIHNNESDTRVADGQLISIDNYNYPI